MLILNLLYGSPMTDYPETRRKPPETSRNRLRRFPEVFTKKNIYISKNLRTSPRQVSGGFRRVSG